MRNRGVLSFKSVAVTTILANVLIGGVPRSEATTENLYTSNNSASNAPASVISPVEESTIKLSSLSPLLVYVIGPPIVSASVALTVPNEDLNE